MHGIVLLLEFKTHSKVLLELENHWWYNSSKLATFSKSGFMEPVLEPRVVLDLQVRNGKAVSPYLVFLFYWENLLALFRQETSIFSRENRSPRKGL